MLNHLVVAGRNIWSAQRGGVAIFFAVVLSALIGFAALGTEVGFAMFKQRQMQSAANAAAVSGATAVMTGSPASAVLEARAVAAAGGFTDAAAGATVTVNRPPLSGSFAANAEAIEVIVRQPQTLPLSGLFHVGTWYVGARGGDPGPSRGLLYRSAGRFGLRRPDDRQQRLSQQHHVRGVGEFHQQHRADHGQ